MVGLLTEQSEVPAISSELASAGVDVAAVEILCGEREQRSWTRMAATTGCEPGSCGPFSGSAYDETTLAIYDEALRHGDLLLRVPARPRTATASRRCSSATSVHDVGYFGPGTFEQFPIPDTG